MNGVTRCHKIKEAKDGKEDKQQRRQDAHEQLKMQEKERTTSHLPFIT
jgi:hypothetical protein